MKRPRSPIHPVGPWRSHCPVDCDSHYRRLADGRVATINRHGSGQVLRIFSREGVTLHEQSCAGPTAACAKRAYSQLVRRQSAFVRRLERGGLR